MVLRIKRCKSKSKGVSITKTLRSGWDYPTLIEPNIANGKTSPALKVIGAHIASLFQLRLSRSFSAKRGDFGWLLAAPQRGRIHVRHGKVSIAYTEAPESPVRGAEGRADLQSVGSIKVRPGKIFKRPRKRSLSIEVSLFLFTYTTFINLPYYIYCRRRCRGTTYWFGLRDTCWQLLATSLLRVHHFCIIAVGW